MSWIRNPIDATNQSGFNIGGNARQSIILQHVHEYGQFRHADFGLSVRFINYNFSCIGILYPKSGEPTLNEQVYFRFCSIP